MDESDIDAARLIADLASLGITQAHIARRIGASAPFVSQLARGQRQLTDYRRTVALLRLHAQISPALPATAE